jgi:hypothetical protein
LFIDDLFEWSAGEPSAGPGAMIADVPITLSTEGPFALPRGITDDLGLTMGTGDRRGLEQRSAGVPIVDDKFAFFIVHHETSKNNLPYWNGFIGNTK